MRIHTVKPLETLTEIAKAYGISEENIIHTNSHGIKNAAIGEEILILTPTRTYVLKKNDTIERLCLRFRTRKSDILSQNPWIIKDGLIPGRSVVLKYDDKTHGTSAANGYFYSGCDIGKLKMSIPYLTYVTVGCSVSDKDGVYQIFDDGEIMSIINAENKIPLLRIYDAYKGRKYDDKSLNTKYINNMIQLAKTRGYMGIVLSCAGDVNSESFCEFVVEFKKSLLGCDLILLIEMDEKSSYALSDFTDGCVLSYQKDFEEESIDFDNGERKVYSDFACFGECAKTFIEIPALARGEDNIYMSKDEAIELARENRAEISTDPISKISYFDDKTHGRISFASLENIKAVLNLIEEYGYMGIAFDIDKTPLSHLLMYNACFRTAAYTNARISEGCSRS